MVGRLIEIANSAYQYPPIFKQLWHTQLTKEGVAEQYGNM
jgi:hypothetical protein